MEKDTINSDSNMNKCETSKSSTESKTIVSQPCVNAGALPKYRIKTNAFDFVAMLLSFVLTFLFIGSVIFASNTSWKTTASYLGIFALATAYITIKQKKLNAQTILTGALCVVLSLSFALRSNPFEINCWVIITLIYLSGSYCIALTGSNRHSRGSYFFLLDVLKTEVLIPLKHFFQPYAAMHNTRITKKQEKKSGNKKTDKKYLAVIIGVVCAFPVLLIVVPLLIKGDAAFESMAGTFLEKLIGFFKNFEDSFGRIISWLESNIFILVPTVFVATYIFSVMFSYRHGISNEENRDTSKKYAKLRFGSPALFSGFLGVICMVYLIYILSQTAYFFSAFSGKLPDGTGITVAEYARRGFFELAGVAALNLVLIAFTVLFSRRKGKEFSPVIKAFDLFLCAFNILLSAVSMSKIVLYMNEMGLTHKRIYVFLIDIAMIIAFLCIAVRFFNEKFPYMKVITGTLCVIITAISLFGINGIIAKYNTEKYLSGRIKSNSIYELLDNIGMDGCESYVKIAESKTKLRGIASEQICIYVGAFESEKNKEDEDGWPDYHDLLLKDGKVILNNNDYLFNIDARNAVRALNERIDVVKKALADNAGNLSSKTK